VIKDMRNVGDRIHVLKTSQPSLPTPSAQDTARKVFSSVEPVAESGPIGAFPEKYKGLAV